MEGLYQVLSWGTPLCISLFLFFSAADAGIFFWGISCLQSKNQQEKSE